MFPDVKRLSFLLGKISSISLLSLSAWASDGINSTTGSPLPIGAGDGKAIMVFPQEGANSTGNILIGTNSENRAHANLEVTRGVKIGTDESFTEAGGVCTKPGTLSQARTSDGNLYVCALKTGTTYVWKSLGRSGSVYGLQNLTMVPYGKTVQSSILQYTAEGSASVSVSSPGKISINGGPWVSSGTVSTGQTVQLQVTAPAADNATISVTLTTGTEDNVWSVTTAPSTWAQGGAVVNGPVQNYNYFSRWCRVGIGCGWNLCYYNCDQNIDDNCVMAAGVRTSGGSNTIVDYASPGGMRSFTTDTSRNAYLQISVCPSTLSPPNPTGLLSPTPPYGLCTAYDAGNVDYRCVTVP